MIKVHGVHGSPFVRKVLIALELKGLEFQQIPQMPFMEVSEEYRKLSPLGKIPALEDGDLQVSDSTVICEYLEDAYPEPPLYPRDPVAKARARWYEEYGATRLAELTAGIFFQRFMRPFAFQQEPDEELIAKIIEKRLPPELDYLEGQVPAEGFLFGDFQMADLALVSPFINAAYANYEVDASQWPLLAAYIARVSAIPEVAALVAREKSALGLDSPG